jgi:hypothetical protein
VQPRPGEVARTGQAIVSGTDDDGVVRMRHSQEATTMCSTVKTKAQSSYSDCT